MSSLNSISEEYSEEFEEIEESIGTSEKYSSQLEEDSSDLQRKFIEKKIRLLSRKNRAAAAEAKKVTRVSQIFSQQISKLQKPNRVVSDKFYLQPADIYQISKLAFENQMSQIKNEGSRTDLVEENKLLQKKCEKIDIEKFITAQYYRLKSKPL